MYKNILKLINELNKVEGNNISRKKSIVFPHTGNENLKM